MADFDWNSFSDNAKKYGEDLGSMYGMQKSAPQIDTSIEPPLVEPASVQQEQQAAQQLVIPEQQPQPAVMPPQPLAMAPQPIQQSGMMPVQTTVQSTSVSPKLIEKQNEIETKALDAQQALTEAQVAQNKLLAEQATAQSNELAAANQRALTQQAYDEEQRQVRMGEVEKAVQDFNSNKTVNPNRAYERMGVGGRILATIGQAFGAFGAAITHSPNYAQQMIERAIDADIRAQEQDINARGQAVNMANNNLAAFRQKGLDNQASMAAERLRLLQASNSKVDEILANTKNPQTIAAGQQIKAGIEKSYNDTLMHYGQTSKSTTLQNASMGSAGAQLPAKQAEDLGTANAAISAAEDVYNSWKKDASGISGAVKSMIPGTDAMAFKDKRAMAKQVIGSYLEGGVLRKEDEAKYDKYLPEPGDSENRALRKRDSLIALISSRASSQKTAQKQAGFNVDKIKVSRPVTTFKPLE